MIEKERGGIVEPLTFENAPENPAHYAPAVVAQEGKTVYISGQLPIDPVSRVHSTGDIQAQTLQALQNMEAIVKVAGGTKESIVRTTAYITTMEHWLPVNQVYAQFFGDHKPSRTIVAVPEIHFDLLVEIDGIAVV